MNREAVRSVSPVLPLATLGHVHFQITRNPKWGLCLFWFAALPNVAAKARQRGAEGRNRFAVSVCLYVMMKRVRRVRYD